MLRGSSRCTKIELPLNVPAFEANVHLGSISSMSGLLGVCTHHIIAVHHADDRLALEGPHTSPGSVRSVNM